MIKTVNQQKLETMFFLRSSKRFSAADIVIIHPSIQGSLNTVLHNSHLPPIFVCLPRTLGAHIPRCEFTVIWFS